LERIITVVLVSKDPDCCQGFHHGDELRISGQDTFCEFFHSRTAPSHPVLFLKLTLKLFPTTHASVPLYQKNMLNLIS
jgi:hypothetical protein